MITRKDTEKITKERLKEMDEDTIESLFISRKISLLDIPEGIISRQVISDCVEKEKDKFIDHVLYDFLRLDSDKQDDIEIYTFYIYRVLISKIRLEEINTTKEVIINKMMDCFKKVKDKKKLMIFLLQAIDDLYAEEDYDSLIKNDIEPFFPLLTDSFSKNEYKAIMKEFIKFSNDEKFRPTSHRLVKEYHVIKEVK